MAFDYTEVLAAARELVADFGRQIVLVKYDPTPSNASTPWLGPTSARAGAGTLTATVWAVIVEPSNLLELGEVTLPSDFDIKRLDMIYIAEPGDTDPDDLDTYDEVRDEGLVYKLEKVSKLRAGGTTLLYFLGAKR